MVSKIVILFIFPVYFQHIWHVYCFSPQQGVFMRLSECLNMLCNYPVQPFQEKELQHIVYL